MHSRNTAIQGIIKMKNKGLVLFFILFFCAAAFIFPNSNPWGNIKKIHFYDSVKKYNKVLETLEQIHPGDIDRGEKEEVAANLIRFGDYYFSKGEYDTAEAFYKKVLNFSPDYWYLYNKLEKINREKGGGFIHFSNVFSQLVLVLQSFKSSFLVFDTFFNMTFFAGLFVFFLFAMILFIKYFRLAGNDLLINEDSSFSIKKTAFLAIALLWPAVVLSGWMIYPFLITGFLWVYLNEKEKKTIFYFLMLVAVFTLLYSFNLMVEKSAADENFKTIRQVYNGHLFERQEYEKFDNELKVAQAFSYYENKQYQTALEILLATGETYKNKLKFDLMGSIYFRSENFSESVNNFNESLRIHDKDPVTLNNFTLALLKENDEEVFDSYAKRYPEIQGCRTKVSGLKNVNISPSGLLWKRLLNFSSERFNFPLFIKNLLVEFFQLPIIYFILVFIVYIFGLRKLSHPLGGSTYCSKCSKIIKEASIHKSYKLCDECYQLFLIKDVIFLEAKIIKEKELDKKFKKKYAVALIFSLFIPGLNLNFREKNQLFVLLSCMFYFLLGFAVIGMLTFTKIFSTAPIILNVVGMLAFVFYLVFNLISILGDYDGF